MGGETKQRMRKRGNEIQGWALHQKGSVCVRCVDYLVCSVLCGVWDFMAHSVANTAQLESKNDPFRSNVRLLHHKIVKQTSTTILWR